MLYFWFLLLFLKSVKHVWQMIIPFQIKVPIAVPKGNMLAAYFRRPHGWVTVKIKDPHISGDLCSKLSVSWRLHYFRLVSGISLLISCSIYRDCCLSFSVQKQLPSCLICFHHHCLWDGNEFQRDWIIRRWVSKPLRENTEKSTEQPDPSALVGLGGGGEGLGRGW